MGPFLIRRDGAQQRRGVVVVPEEGREIVAVRVDGHGLLVHVEVHVVEGPAPELLVGKGGPHPAVLFARRIEAQGGIVDRLQDPELGQEFLGPLKLQGIADVIDNALVCRVKFTVRPIKPTWVQRQALKRIYAAFKKKGIEFASNAVTLHTAGRAEPSVAAAAASAGARRAPEMP